MSLEKILPCRLKRHDQCWFRPFCAISNFCSLLFAKLHDSIEFRRRWQGPESRRAESRRRLYRTRVIVKHQVKFSMVFGIFWCEDSLSQSVGSLNFTPTFNFRKFCTWWRFLRVSLSRRCNLRPPPAFGSSSLYGLCSKLQNTVPKHTRTLIWLLQVWKRRARSRRRTYTRLYPTKENCHVHGRPGRTRVIDSRQLTDQFASPVNMIILTIVGSNLVRGGFKQVCLI